MSERAGTSFGRVAGVFLVCMGLVSCLPAPAAAQAVTGTIIGTVADSTGAVVAGAKVTITNTGTGLTRTVTSDSAGEYTAPSLPTGTYLVTGEMAGFKTAALSGIELGVSQRVKIDVTLEVGNMTESVTIQAATPLLQTSSSELGTTVEEEQIQTMPLNGRNFVSLTRTVPGVLRGIPGSNIDGAGSLAWRASASFSANGQRSRDNNYMLDGVDNNETWLQTVVIFPSVDALDEFKLQTSTYSAEFGRSLGGVVNLQIKSGTNSFRGSAFEFHRNDALDANNFFNNRGGREKPDFKQNQFGGHVRRSCVQGPDVLLRRLPGTSRRTGSDLPVERPVHADAAGKLLGVQPCHLRSHDGTAVRGQFHPRVAVGPGVQKYSAGALSGAEHGGLNRRRRPACEQLLDQPGEGAAGQPVRREGGPQPHRQQSLLHALQLSEDASAAAGDSARTGMQAPPSVPAMATSRRRASRSTTPTRSTATG